MKRRRGSGCKHMMVLPPVKNFFSRDPIWWTSQRSGLPSSLELDQPAHPPSDEICDHRHSDSDDEHVESRAESSTAGEDRSRRTDHEVRQHRDRERDHDCGRSMPDEEGKYGNCRTERGAKASRPPSLGRGLLNSPILSSSCTCSLSIR